MNETKEIFKSKPEQMSEIHQDLQDIRRALWEVGKEIKDLVEVIEKFRYTYYCVEKGYDDCYET